MSALYKRERSPYWWWSSTYRGRRFAQSTRLTDKSLAKKIANKWDFQLINDDLSFMKSEKSNSQTLEGFIQHYLNLISSRKSDKAYRTAKGILNRFSQFMKDEKVKLISDVSLQSINNYIDRLTKKKNEEMVSLSPKSKRNHLIEISLMLDQALDEEVVKVNYAKRVKLPRMVKKDLHRELDMFDLELIFNNAGSWHLLYSFLYHTGLRVGDVAMLKYKNIDFNKKSIVTLIRKSQRTHEFPIAQALLEQLDSSNNPDTPIFPNMYCENERKLNDKFAKPRKYMQAILSSNGRKHATLHSFRTTFNNQLRDLGLTIEDRQTLMAHASSETTKIYTNPNFDLASQYVNRLKRFDSLQYN